MGCLLKCSYDHCRIYLCSSFESNMFCEKKNGAGNAAVKVHIPVPFFLFILMSLIRLPSEQIYNFIILSDQYPYTF